MPEQKVVILPLIAKTEGVRKRLLMKKAFDFICPNRRGIYRGDVALRSFAHRYGKGLQPTRRLLRGCRRQWNHAINTQTNRPLRSDSLMIRQINFPAACLC
jgi:hypothetical protein